MNLPLRRLRSWTVASASLAAIACTAPPTTELRAVSGAAQGTTYSLQWVGGGSAAEVARVAEDELARIDALLSNYRTDSTLERLNAARTTEPLELPAELVSLLGVAKRIHEESAGCFDPTVRPLVRAWGFDGDVPAVPSPAAIETARAAVGLDKLELLDATHVRKRVAGLEIDMASLGQGYTAARLAAVLDQHGSAGFLAEIGGEIVARGTKPDGSAWRVGVEDPLAQADRALRLPPAATTAVITSGSYRQYFEVDGRRFGHIIDPRNGWPVEHSLLSVTVLGDDATAAAAWATALLCLGPQEGRVAAQRAGVAAILWLDEGGAAAVELTPAFPRELLDELR